MKKILVTGSSGFLGAAVVRNLTEKGFKIKATGRNKKKLNMLNCAEKIVCNLENEKETLNLVDGCDAIIHCAALSSPWGKWEDFQNSNVQATLNLTSAALQKKLRRFVHISTPSIYLGMKKKENIFEDDLLPHKFVNMYAQTKFQAEQVINDAVNKGLHAVTLRPQALFGPEDSVILPRFLRANEKIGIPLINNGAHKIDLTFVDNVAHAVYLALVCNSKYVGEKFNITNGSPVCFKIFVEDMFYLLGIKPKFKKIPLWALQSGATVLEKYYTIFKSSSEPILTRYTVKVLSESRTLNISKAKKLLGYEPLVSMEEGMQIYAQWWKNNDQANFIY